MATPKLDRILNLLDGGYIATTIGNKHELARNSFPLTSNVVSGHPEFYDVTVRYYRHHYSYTISPHVVLPEEMAASEVRNILDHAFREHGGYVGAYECSRTGVAGGLSGVLNAVANALRTRQEIEYVDHVIRTECNEMVYDEIVELMRQYVDRFGHYLAPADRARSPHDLARNYDTVIKQHVRAMDRIRGLIKKI